MHQGRVTLLAVSRLATRLADRTHELSADNPLVVEMALPECMYFINEVLRPPAGTLLVSDFPFSFSILWQAFVRETSLVS